MRHYSLIPVRYNEQQLLVRCEPVDAELWSIQWFNGEGRWDAQPLMPAWHWFADCSPIEHNLAAEMVSWLNTREQMIATLPPDLTVVESRSK